LSPYLSLVVPFFNEEGGVARVVLEADASLRASALPFENVAVQNGSTDATGAELASLRRLTALRVVEVPIYRGYGFGVRYGLARCRGELLAYMPGDGRIDPRCLVQLVERMWEAESHIGKAAAVVKLGSWRRGISRVLHALSALLVRSRYAESSGAAIVLTRGAHRALRLRSNDHFLDAEMALKAKRIGLRLSELAVEAREPFGGGDPKLGGSRLRRGTRAVLRARRLRRDAWALRDRSLRRLDRAALAEAVARPWCGAPGNDGLDLRQLA